MILGKLALGIIVAIIICIAEVYLMTYGHDLKYEDLSIGISVVITITYAVMVVYILTIKGYL